MPVSPKGLTGIDSSDKPRFFRSAGGVKFEMCNIQTQHALTSKYVHIFNAKCSKEALSDEDFFFLRQGRGTSGGGSICKPDLRTE